MTTIEARKVVPAFDDLDLFYLANVLTPQQLRREIRHADVMAKVDEFYRGTLYAEATLFFWADYAAACREALACQKPTPLPAAKQGKHIDIQALKSHLDIVEVIEQYTQLRKCGHNRFSGRCPLHEDKHPSLTVYADQQSWHCFQCGMGGDVISFVMAANTCDFKQATAILGGA